MSKEIRMQRNELVWQSRTVCWNENDWNNLKKWVATQAEIAREKLGGWYQQFVKINEVIKDMTWDEAVEQYEKWDNGDEDQLYWEETYAYTDETYKVFFGEWLQDQIREDCYDADIDGEDYADDYDENVEVLDNDEDED